MSTDGDTSAVKIDHSGDDSPAPSLQSVDKRFLPLDVLREIAKNVGMGIPPVRAWRLRRPRAGKLFSGSNDDLERYAFFPVRNLLEVIGGVRNLDIVEIGPGDFMTSGLSLLAAGAKSYTIVDRFPGNYQTPEAKVWYHGIEDAWKRVFPLLPWPDYLKAEDFPEAYSDRIEVLTGTIEDAEAAKQYDVVCSYQVGEHVNDIGAFAKANAQLLKPDGVAVHRVDFGPHDCWSYYPDPLTFLRFPNWLWSLMSSNRGTPNRRRHHEFCDAFAKAGWHVEVLGTEYFAEGKIDYSRLATEFREMPQSSIQLGTAIYLCRLNQA